MANAIPTGINDRNGKPVYTGQTVKMHYFYIGFGENLGATECERVVEGVVRVQGYRYKNRIFCVETKDKIRYPFKLMEDPEEQIEIIKDWSYAKDRLDKRKG